jgi:hypothetical protein
MQPAKQIIDQAQERRQGQRLCLILAAIGRRGLAQGLVPADHRKIHQQGIERLSLPIAFGLKAARRGDDRGRQTPPPYVLADLLGQQGILENRQILAEAAKLPKKPLSQQEPLVAMEGARQTGSGLGFQQVVSKTIRSSRQVEVQGKVPGQGRTGVFA